MSSNVTGSGYGGLTRHLMSSGSDCQEFARAVPQQECFALFDMVDRRIGQQQLQRLGGAGGACCCEEPECGDDQVTA